MRVALDARLTGPGLGIGHFVTSLAHGLLARGDVELVWLGSPQRAPSGSQVIPCAGRLPYPLLDMTATATLVRRLGVDLVHFTGNTGWRRAAAIPTLLTVHDLIFMRSGAAGALRQRLGHAYERYAAPQAIQAASRVVAVSEATAVELRAGWRDDVLVIYHGASGARLTSPLKGEPDDPFLVAFAARDPRKATLLAVDAFRRLRGRVKRLHLLAAAGLPSGFEHVAADLLATGELVVHERLERTELDRLIGRATALVYPSRDEGFGLPVLDGMRLGVPVVTGLCAATREVGGDAILVIDPVAPTQSIADAVERLLGDRALAEQLGERGVERASRFTWREAARRYVEAYRAVVS